MAVIVNGGGGRKADATPQENSTNPVQSGGVYTALQGKADSSSLGTAAAKNYTTSVTQDSSDLVTSGAVKTAIDNLPEPMVFKGTLGTGGTITTLPAAASSNEGYTYKVITAGTYASQAAKVGDVFVSNGSAWVIIPAGDEDSDTWRNIKINGTEVVGTGISSGAINFKNGTNVAVSASGNDITISATDTTYESKTAASGGTAVSLVTTGEKYTWNNKVSDNPTFSQASSRANIASGESFSTIFGKIMKWFADLGTAAFKNIPSSGNASTSEVVMGDDTRLSDSRPASDVSAWAKASTKPTYAYSEITGTPTIPTYNFSGVAFYSGNQTTAEHNCNNAVKNGNYYYTTSGPTTTLGATTADGALYVQSYSDSWVAQIAQDYRNGNLFTRGKNNGTWQAWRKVAYSDDISGGGMAKTSVTVASSGWTAESKTSARGTTYAYKKEVTISGMTTSSYVDIAITSGTYTEAFCVESASGKAIIRTATQPSGSLTFDIYYANL